MVVAIEIFGELIGGAKCLTGPICQTLERKVGQASRQDKNGYSELQSVVLNVPHFSSLRAQAWELPGDLDRTSEGGNRSSQVLNT